MADMGQELKSRTMYLSIIFFNKTKDDVSKVDLRLFPSQSFNLLLRVVSEHCQDVTVKQSRPMILTGIKGCEKRRSGECCSS